MNARRSALILAVALITLFAGSAQAIYISNCPQICTPGCPCSLTCLGPFGNTTCGAAGQACTPYLSDEVEEDVLFAYPAFLTTEAPFSTLDQSAEATVEPEENTDEQDSQDTTDQDASEADDQ